VDALAHREINCSGLRRFIGAAFVARLVGVSLLLGALSASAQAVHPTESQVKAAYLYNFGKFVTWQMDRGAGSTLDICVLGKDPFGPVLDSTVSGESIDGHPIAVKRLVAIQDGSHCSILFIGSSEEGRLTSILPFTQSYGILTVSDMPHFAERGGVIGFVSIEDKIRFEVNRSAAEQSHLTLSSELLKVASSVIEQSSNGRRP
jgi:hypothetical protein